MAFDFENETKADTVEEKNIKGCNDHITRKICDVVIFKNIPNVPDDKFENTKIYRDGYYSSGYYMLHPFYYLTHEVTSVDSIYCNFAILTKIQPQDDLENLSKKSICQSVNTEFIENIPIVVFRRHEGPITLTPNGKDLSMTYNCQNDTFEFIGVYKATAIGAEKFKLTRIFDRYYFRNDGTKMKNSK